MKYFISFFSVLLLSMLIWSCNSKASEPKVASFKISGMTCAYGCAKTIENTLSKTAGVTKATVDFDSKMAHVTYDASLIDADNIIKTVQKTGDGTTYKVFDFK